MKVLIIGGTSFIGPFVLASLLAAGHRVALFNRGTKGFVLPPDVLHISGDRENLAEFRAEFSGFAPDVVIDMIPLYERHAQAVCSVFEDIASQVVFISSMDVYRAYGILTGIEQGLPVPVPMDESAPLREKLFPYRGLSPRHEDYEKILVERAAAKGNIPWTVLRLPMVYGPGDYQHRMYPFLKRMLDARPAIVMSEAESLWQTTRCYVGNVAAAVTACVGNDCAKDKIFNAGDQLHLNTKSWVQAIALAVGWKGTIVVVPRNKWPTELEAGANYAQQFIVDASAIRNATGYCEPHTLADGVIRTVEWERDHPPSQLPEAAYNYHAEDALLAKLAD